ncbi:MAG: hypothetical protein Q4D98_05560 [Planctomycetia bacterium]|nr:hypothetical protein [Planctomycetia bacterium]
MGVFGGLLLLGCCSVQAVDITGTEDASSYRSSTETLNFQNGTMTNTNSGTTTLSNAVTIGSGYTGTFDVANPLTLSGTLSGTGTLIKEGTARLTVTSTNTTGLSNISVDAGTLFFSGGLGSSNIPTLTVAGGATLSGNGDILTKSVTFATGAILDVAAGATFTLRGTQENFASGEIIKTGAGLFQFGTFGNTGITSLVLREGIYGAHNANRIVGATVTLDGGTYQWYNKVDGEVLANNFVVTDNGGTLNTNGYNVDLSEVFTGSGTVQKTGAGAIKFTNAKVFDDFSGTLAIQTGTAFITGNNLGDGCTSDLKIEVASGATLSGNGNVWAKEISLAEGSIIHVDSKATLYIRGTQADFISGSFIKTGAGTLALGTNDSTKLTSITLREGTFENYSAGRISGAQVTFEGGTFAWLGDHNPTNAFVVTNAGGTMDIRNYNNAVSGNITGEGILQKKGAGTLTLSGTASDFGGLDIQEGSVMLTNTSPLVAADKTFVVTGNTGNEVLNIASTTTWLGTLDVTNATVNFSTTRTLNGSGTKMGNISVTDGTLTFTATNVFGTGDVLPDLLTLTRSTLQNKVPSGNLWSNMPNMVLNDSTILKGTGTNSQIYVDGKITATGNSRIEEPVFFRSDGHAVKVDGVVQSGLVEVAENSTLTITSKVVLHDSSSSTNVLVKSGEGTLILATSGTSNVPLRVTDGLLEIASPNGMVAGSSLTVDNGGTAYISTPNQKISGALTVNEGGVLQFNLDAFHSSQYTGGSLLTVGSIASLTNDNFAFVVDDIYNGMLIEFASENLVNGYTGLTADSIAKALAEVYNVNGIPYMVVSNLESGGFAVTYNTAGLPEPTSALLLLLGLLFLKRKR